MSEVVKPYIVVNWSDSTTSVQRSKEVCCERFEKGADVMLQVKNDMWKGKIESVHDSKVLATARVNDLCGAVNKLIEEVPEGKRERKKSRRSVDNDSVEDEIENEIVREPKKSKIQKIENRLEKTVVNLKIKANKEIEKKKTLEIEKEKAFLSQIRSKDSTGGNKDKDLGKETNKVSFKVSSKALDFSSSEEEENDLNDSVMSDVITTIIEPLSPVLPSPSFTCIDTNLKIQPIPKTPITNEVKKKKIPISGTKHYFNKSSKQCQTCTLKDNHISALQEENRILKSEVNRLNQTIDSGQYLNGSNPRSGLVPQKVAEKYKMEEICNSIYVTQSQYLALSSKKSTSAALFLLDCFYTKEEQLHMTVNGTVGKGKINGTLLDSILGYCQKTFPEENRARIKLALRNKLSSFQTKHKLKQHNK